MFIDKPLGGAAIQESHYALSYLISQLIDFNGSHWAPRLLALRTLGQPSDSHCSIKATGHLSNEPNLIGRGHRPASAMRRTCRSEQPQRIPRSLTDSMVRPSPPVTLSTFFEDITFTPEQKHKPSTAGLA
jgi:hypothetical protein